MRQTSTEFSIRTRGKGLYEFTSQVEAWLREQRFTEGLLTLLIRHTSASLVIQENADPDVVRDLQAYFERLAPEGDLLYRHILEGPDDMPAHVRAALTAVNLSIPIRAGALTLGTWQGIYVFEHRRGPHTRNVAAHAFGI